MNITYVIMQKGVPEGCTPIHLYVLINDDVLKELYLQYIIVGRGASSVTRWARKVAQFFFLKVSKKHPNFSMSCQKHPNFCNSSHNSFYVQTAQQVLTIGAAFARKFGSKTFEKQCNLVTLYGGDIIIIIIFYSKKILFS